MPTPPKHPAIVEIEQAIEKYLREADDADAAMRYVSAQKCLNHAIGMEKALRIVKRHLEG